jgi:predicted dehydrogenase
MNVGVVGYGSIGARHARILSDAHHDVCVVSQRDEAPFTTYRTLKELLDSQRIDYLIIATPTSSHRQNLEEVSVSGFTGRLLVEKPLLAIAEPLPQLAVTRAAVGYNLRFHPTVRRLRDITMTSKQVDSASFVVGQHLADWRPARDYRTTYSAHRNLGGGLLRDLSHELDLARFLFGELTLLNAEEGRSTELEADRPHEVALRASSTTCKHITISMNMIDRPATRFIEVTTGEGVIRADLLTAQLEVSGTITSDNADRDLSYRLMHQEMTSHKTCNAASFADGLATVAFIDTIEKALESVGI